MAGHAVWFGSELPTARAVIEAWREAGGQGSHDITVLELVSSRDAPAQIQLTMKLSSPTWAAVREPVWIRCTGVSELKLNQNSSLLFSGSLKIEDLQRRGWDPATAFRIFDPEQDNGISFYAQTLEWCVGARPTS